MTTLAHRIAGLAGGLLLMAAAAGCDVAAEDAPPPPPPDNAQSLLPRVTVPAAIEDHGTVGTTYHQVRPSYMGELTLSLVCTGRGRVNLVVSGVPVAEAGNQPRELARIGAQCAGDTTPGQAVFQGDEFLQNLVFDLTGSDDAVGQAAFAYRITSDTGRPTTSADYVNKH